MDQNPGLFVEIDFLDFITKNQEIEIFWKTESNLINRDGIFFSDCIKEN